jgi:hypothetical protein
VVTGALAVFLALVYNDGRHEQLRARVGDDGAPPGAARAVDIGARTPREQAHDPPLLQVPLAIPIGVLVFLGAFVPFVGAVVTGALAVFLALGPARRRGGAP